MAEDNRSDVPFHRRGSVRALAPLAVAAIVAGGVALAPTFAAAAPNLPPISAQDLLAKAAQSKVDTFSGTVVVSTNLGLPALPDLNGGANPLSLLGGTHTLQVAADGHGRQRIALLDTFSEYDLVHNGSDVWVYDSSRNTVEHGTASADAAKAGAHPEKPGVVALTPQEAAQKLLAAVEPTTKVAVQGTRSVANRSAYLLEISPKQAGSLIGRVEIAVDSANGAPLDVAVYPVGSTSAAFEVGYTRVDFSAPSAGQFDFTPPKGATVSPLTGPHGGGSKQGTNTDAVNSPAPQVLGRGWIAVVELHGVNLSQLAKNAPSGESGHSGHDGTGLFDGSASSYLNALIGAGRTVQGGYGTGKLYTTNFLSVLITDDGQLFAGAVTPSVLEADAAAQGTR